MKLEMEQARLKRQSEYDKIISELNSTSTRDMDSIFLSNIILNGSYNNRNSTQQERNAPNFGHKYSEEEKQQVQKRIQKSLKAGEELLAMLDDEINRYNSLNSLDEGQNARHRRI